MERPEADTAVDPSRIDSTTEPIDESAPATANAPSPLRSGPSGRRLYTLEELPPKVRLRVEHSGKWVAWSADGETIVVSAESLKDVLNAPERAANPGTVLEWLGD